MTKNNTENTNTTGAGSGSLQRMVRTWQELASIPDSATHYLEINVPNCNGWIKEKGNPDAFGHYLSTHTFYGSNHEYSTALLRQCGFNVTLANWDCPNDRAQTPPDSGTKDHE